MKKNLILLTVLMTTAFTTATAQAYRNSRYYNPGNDRLDYSHGPIDTARPPIGRQRYSPSHWNNDCYLGLRIGPSFSTLGGDFSNSGTVTGLNVGVTLGTAISNVLPLYFETGLTYTEKGASNMRYYYDNDISTNGDLKLGYLELPLTIKYAYSPDNKFSVQPFVGGYLAYGCNSTYKGDRDIKMFGDKGEFQRFDGGLRVGCGISYDVLYAEVAFDYGLSNIEKESNLSTHTSSVQICFGVNF